MKKKRFCGTAFIIFKVISSSATVILNGQLKKAYEPKHFVNIISKNLMLLAKLKILNY